MDISEKEYKNLFLERVMNVFLALPLSFVREWFISLSGT